MPQSERPLAVVTGASSGIGRALAHQFAAHGYDLIVAAEDAELDEATAELRGEALSVRPVQVDLTSYEGVEKLYAAIAGEGRPLAAAALNAGVGLGGRFVDQPLAAALHLVHLNVLSTVHLAHRVLADMAERGEGKVLFTSSIASMAPGSYQALYNASKSFVQSFAEAVADELRDTGVTITALMPGPTDTEFFDKAALTDTKLGTTSHMADAADVAQTGFDALMAGKSKVVAGGLATKVQAGVMKVLPDKAKAVAHRKQAEPGSAG